MNLDEGMTKPRRTVFFVTDYGIGKSVACSDELLARSHFLTNNVVLVGAVFHTYNDSTIFVCNRYFYVGFIKAGIKSKLLEFFRVLHHDGEKSLAGLVEDLIASCHEWGDSLKSNCAPGSVGKQKGFHVFAFGKGIVHAPMRAFEFDFADRVSAIS